MHQLAGANFRGCSGCELQGSERVGKAEEYMYLQVSALDCGVLPAPGLAMLKLRMGKQPPFLWFHFDGERRLVAETHLALPGALGQLQALNSQLSQRAEVKRCHWPQLSPD